MLNITLRTLLHFKPFRLIINLVESLRISSDLELLKLPHYLKFLPPSPLTL
jgi:hypothetical protein